MTLYDKAKLMLEPRDCIYSSAEYREVLKHLLGLLNVFKARVDLMRGLQKNVEAKCKK